MNRENGSSVSDPKDISPFSADFSHYIKEPRKQIVEGQESESIQMDELLARIDNLEKRDVQEFLTLVEIMSNVTFFGGVKKTNCEYAKNGQCSLFYLQNEAKNKIPIATECRISECSATPDHCHLELSNVTCTFCPQWNSQNIVKSDKQNSVAEEK